MTRFWNVLIIWIAVTRSVESFQPSTISRTDLKTINSGHYDSKLSFDSEVRKNPFRSRSSSVAATKNDDTDKILKSISSSISSGATSAPLSLQKKNRKKNYWTDQWYPVLPLNCFENSTQPIPITILGQDLVAWKNSQGVLSIFDDSCPHRRAPLSTGKISSDGCNLACRYHGYEFDAQGSCTKIPMMTENADKINPKSFRVPTYPTRQAGGTLWVYMNPNVEDPPPIPAEALPDEDQQARSFSVFTIEPISYRSMIENSFDPAHAPFTHEGIKDMESKSVYNPNDAVPMETYQIVEPPSESGFQLEHSPAYKTPGLDKKGNPSDDSETAVTPMITRRFIAPCTVKTHSPGVYDSQLSFVPRLPGETMVIGYFSLPGTASSSDKPTTSTKKQKKSPSKLSMYFMEWVHFYFMAKKSRVKFASQDRMNMLGQDAYRRLHNTKIDPAPTVSDFGVLTFQKWIQTFAEGGPFARSKARSTDEDYDAAAVAAPAAAATTMGEQIIRNGDLNRKMYSTWDMHGKYCPICRRSIQRLEKWEKILDRVAKLSFVASAVSAIRSAWSNKVAASPASVLWLVLAVFGRYTSFKCRRAQDFFFSSGEERWVRTMDVYAK